MKQITFNQPGIIMSNKTFDTNFNIPTEINRDGLKFYDADNFSVHGIHRENGRYRRMTAAGAKSVNENIYRITFDTAGGRVRFLTNATKLAIYVEFDSACKLSNYSLSATMGFDIYSGERFVGVFVPPFDASISYESMLSLPYSDGKMHEYVINYPICSVVKRLLIGIDENSEILPANEYKISTPVVFYGSSVTQGACASHPGNSYENILSRALDFDFINLGFGGNARGEAEMGKYISKIKMSAFVYDYDYNAPSPDHLRETHETLFKIVRRANPDLPTIILSAPKPYPDEIDLERQSIVYSTYKNACDNGDKNVYYLSGIEIMQSVKNCCLADNIHPGDVGLLAMANALAPILKNVFSL